MARCTAVPVARSHTTVVSRWLVMPIAAMSLGPTPAFFSASRQVATVEVQMSSGSCSTQPDAGKCCGNSCCADAAMEMSARNTMAREDMMVSLALLPGVFVGWCWAKASGLGREGQYRGRLHARSAPSPACGGGLGWGQVTDDASRKQVTEGGITNIRACCVPPPPLASLRHPPPPRGGG